MKRLYIAGIVIFSSALIIVILSIIYLYHLAPDESYPSDTYLENTNNKRALVVVAHDDDASIFAGTTSKLAEEGWEIHFICFYPYHWRPEDNPVRKVEMGKVARIQGLKNIELIDLELRNRLDTVKRPWMPIPYDQFINNFNMDSLNMFLKNAILKAQPDVIFILDNVIGFYGHPEHVLVGKVVEDICRSYKDSSGFPVKRIYQGVIPPSQAERLMAGSDSYNGGKKIYNCSGMPAPDIQVNIYPYAKKKMSVLLAHASQHRNLKKFFISYNYYPARLYFRIFKNEYFNIIEL